MFVGKPPSLKALNSGKFLENPDIPKPRAIPEKKIIRVSLEVLLLASSVPHVLVSSALGHLPLCKDGRIHLMAMIEVGIRVLEFWFTKKNRGSHLS